MLCRQAEINSDEVYEGELDQYDVIWIPPNMIHAFGLPPNTDLLLFPDKNWAPPAENHLSRELIPSNWDL